MKRRYACPRAICIHKVDEFIEPLEKAAKKYGVSTNSIMRRLGIEFTRNRGLRMRVIREIQGSAKSEPAHEKEAVIEIPRLLNEAASTAAPARPMN